MQTEAYKREDPTSVKQLAVPVDIPNRIYMATRTKDNKKLKAVGELAMIAFYFLLRVGEYTCHGTETRRTKSFRLRNIKFFTAKGMVPLAQLYRHATQVNLVSLTIENQKNGKKGATISHHAIQVENGCCPVKALVERTVDLISMGGTADTLLCAFKDAKSMAWQHVRSLDIVRVVKAAVRSSGLAGKGGYPIEQVGSHSLRAGGAMAMYLNKHTAIEIQRAGRWTSDTFLEYIHCQIDASTRGLAQSMSKSIPFMNMAR